MVFAVFEGGCDNWHGRDHPQQNQEGVKRVQSLKEG